MHDPLVVAFEICRPWPRRSSLRGGRRYRYWPPMVTVWHREPGGADAGEVCRHYDRATRKITHGWRFHVHHWSVQVHLLQRWHRQIFARCGWCGGRSTRRWAVNVSHQWDAPRRRLFRVDRSCFHVECSSVENARRQCTCALPPRVDRGCCVRCGLHLATWRHPAETAAYRALKDIPRGAPGRDYPEIFRQTTALFAQARAEREPVG